MLDPIAEDCLRFHAQMKSQRGTWEAHWREIAELVRPNQDMFQQRERTQGDKRNQKIFDDTAQLALPKFAAAVTSMAFPATQVYQKLTCSNKKLAKVQRVRQWFEDANEVLFDARYAPHANFQSQSGEVVLDIGAFGTGTLFVDDVKGIGIRYASMPLPETYIAQDAWGRVNRVHREFEFTAQQAVEQFDPNRLSIGLVTTSRMSPLTKFMFVHCVGPNDSYDEKTPLHPVNGKRFASYYIELGVRTVVDEGGYRTFPFAVARYETAPREAYGRSPAMKVLATIKTLNEQEKTMLRAGQMIVAPPLMLSDDAALSAFDMRSNALNHGYLDSQGRPMALALETKGRVDIGLDMQNQKREAINDAFLVTLFRILVQEPQITATEAMLRAQEKGQLLAPTMGRMQAELLGTVTERELEILFMSGRLPDLPPELQGPFFDYGIEYQSPLNQAQKAGVGVSILQTVQAIAPLMAIDASVTTIFDMHTAARLLADSNGFPEAAIRDDDEATALATTQAQQLQNQQLINAAPVAAGAVKDLAQARSLVGSSPGGPAPDLGLPTGAPA